MNFTLNETDYKVDDLQQSILRVVNTWGDSQNFPQMKDYGVTKESLLSYLFDKQSILDSMGNERFQLTLLGIFVVIPIFIASLFPEKNLPFGPYTAIVCEVGGALLFGLLKLFMNFLIRKKLAKLYDEDHEAYIAQVLSYRDKHLK